MDTGYVDGTHREVRLLFREAQVELGILLKSVHRLTSRQRPFQLWAKVRVKPCPGARPEGTSFPSGHAATAALYAELLKTAAPELGDKLEQRVKSYGESRLKDPSNPNAEGNRRVQIVNMATSQVAGN